MTISSFFTPAVEGRVRKIGGIYRRNGYVGTDMEDLWARDFGQARSRGILSFNRRIGFPTTLAEMEDTDRTVIGKRLTADRAPQLESKLQNMPVPLTADLVD